MTKNKLLLLLVLLMTAATGAWAQDYYAPSTDEVIILNDVYNASNSGYSSHSAIAWGGAASTSNKNAGDPKNGGQSTSSTVSCYSVKGTGEGKNITLSITGVSKVIVYHQSHSSRYIELRDGSKKGNIIGSGEKSTYYTEVALTATNKYSIFLHGTSTGSDDADFYVYAIKLIAAPATTKYSVTLAEGTEDAGNWKVKVGEGEAQAFPVEGLNGGETVTVTYNGSREVKNVTVVKKGGAVGNTYLKWDGTQKKLVATPMPESFTTVTSENTEWSAGTYVVEGDVTINGMITLKGDVDLIIKDGAKLIVNGYINGDFKNLSIYGQAQKTGQLVVNGSDHHAITSLSTLEVHSAEVTATASGNNKHGGISIDKFNVYGGLVDAKSTAADGGYGISLSGGGSMDIWGGEVKAKGKKDGDWDCGIVCGAFRGATVTVHGGKLWAENAEKKALNYIDLKMGAGFSGKIEYSSDNITWSETVDANAKYVRAGY